MRIDAQRQDEIKEMCLDAGIPHWKVLPEVKQFYANIPESKTYPREIRNTAKNIIARIKGEAEVSESQMLTEREFFIDFSKMGRGV